MSQADARSIETLERNLVFGVLSPPAIARLASTATPIRLERGDRLFQAGDESDAAYLLVAGALEVVTVQADGHEVVLAELGPGAMIGEITILDGGLRSADIVAARTCQLLRLGRTQVLSALRDEPEAALRLAAILATRLRSANDLAVEATTADIGARLARILLREPQPNTRSQSDLARLISTTRETVNRRLARWSADGLIERDRRGVWIADRDRLASAAAVDMSRA